VIPLAGLAFRLDIDLKAPVESIGQLHLPLASCLRHCINGLLHSLVFAASFVRIPSISSASVWYIAGSRTATIRLRYLFQCGSVCDVVLEDVFDAVIDGR